MEILIFYAKHHYRVFSALFIPAYKAIEREWWEKGCEKWYANEAKVWWLKGAEWKTFNCVMANQSSILITLQIYGVKLPSLQRRTKNHRHFQRFAMKWVMDFQSQIYPHYTLFSCAKCALLKIASLNEYTWKI